MWADSCNAIPKSPVGKAAHYALSQRKYLERCLLDGRLEISNNRAERSIEPFVIGRKSFFFANTPKGAGASAVIFSIIETAKENGLNRNRAINDFIPSCIEDKTDRHRDDIVFVKLFCLINFLSFSIIAQYIFYSRTDRIKSL